MSHNVLIISDDTDTSMSLMGRLMEENMQVDYVRFRDDGIKHYIEKDYCLAVIDISSKQLSDLDWLSDIRRQKNTLILILAPENCAFGEVICFDKGADEYIKKPFSLEICLAKIKILVRRCCLDS